MEEVWKDIDEYEGETYTGKYKVSNLGNVYSYHINRNLKTGTHKDGYKFVILSKDGKNKYALVHRLVATAFIPNPDNLPCVNHKDENPANCNVNNLEWCTVLYNNTYNNVHFKRVEALCKKVYGYNCNGELIYEYASAYEANRELGINDSNINACCSGYSLTYKNIVWSYEMLSKQDVLDKFEQKSRVGKPKSMPVNQFDLNGNFIYRYNSGREAERILKINRYQIASVCRGEREQIGGFKFEYA